MIRGRWSEEEDQILISNYSILEPSECAKILNRTISSVKGRAIKLGVKNSKYWTEEDLEFLKENYTSLGSKDCSVILNKPIKSVTSKANSLGLKSPLHWKPCEVDYLKENYPKVGPKGCQIHLNRSIDAITLKASKLKLKAPGSWDHFSDKDLLELVKEHRLVSKFMYNKELPDHKVLLRRFDKSSWREILELAEVPPNGYRPEDAAIFYILKFQDTNSAYFYKYGYTQNGLKIRYKHRKDFEVVYEKEVSILEALSMEKDIKNYIIKYSPEDARFYKGGHGGYTECFSHFIKEPEWLLTPDKKER